MRCKEERKEKKKKRKKRAAKCNKQVPGVLKAAILWERVRPPSHPSNFEPCHVQSCRECPSFTTQIETFFPKPALIIHTPHEFPTLWGRNLFGKIYPSFRGYLLQALQHSSSQNQPRNTSSWPPMKRALTCSDTPRA